MESAAPKRVAVIGGGALGVRIAAELCLCGIENVLIYDSAVNATSEIPSKVRDTLETHAASGLLGTEEEASSTISSAVSHLQVCSSIEEVVKDVELVIEAIHESLEAKVTLFEELHQCAPADAILTTNTLTIPLGKVAAAIPDKRNVVGLRFLYPVVLIPFVELTSDIQTMDNEQAMNQVASYMAAIGKSSFMYNDEVSKRIRILQEEGRLTATNQYEVREELMQQGLLRFRLSREECARHQEREARLRRVAGVGITNVVGVPARTEAAKIQDDLESCVICWDAEPNAVILSCGHRAFCLPCAQRLNTDSAPCPLCRTRMRGVFELVDKVSS